MPRIIDPLAKVALYTLEEVVFEARMKLTSADPSPMRRTWGARLALAYLFGIGIGERRQHDAFWRAMGDKGLGVTPALDCYCRFTALNGGIECFYRAAGVDRTPSVRDRGQLGPELAVWRKHYAVDRREPGERPTDDEAAQSFPDFGEAKAERDRVAALGSVRSRHPRAKK